MRQLDIVLPCYNPIPNWAENVVRQIKNISQLLPQTQIFLCLVNDGSTQGVLPADLHILKSSLKNFHYLSYSPNQGKGYALRQGVEWASHEICIFTDVDFPYEVESFLGVYEALVVNGYDIVAGVRDDSYYKDMTGPRGSLSKLLKFLNSQVFQLPINDTQCGIKGFNQKGRKVFLQTKINRYLFDLEFIFLSAKDLTLKFKAVSVMLRPGISFRKFNTRILLTESRSFIKLFLSSYL